MNLVMRPRILAFRGRDSGRPDLSTHHAAARTMASQTAARLTAKRTLNPAETNMARTLDQQAAIREHVTGLKLL